MYMKRARSWVGTYSPTSGGDRRQCCIPELLTISHTNNNFGILINLKKEDHDSRCFFRNTKTSIHQITALAPQSNTITKMADGQPLRFIHNGDTLILDQPANEGCGTMLFNLQNICCCTPWRHFQVHVTHWWWFELLSILTDGVMYRQSEKILDDENDDDDDEIEEEEKSLLSTNKKGNFLFGRQ